MTSRFASARIKVSKELPNQLCSWPAGSVFASGTYGGIMMMSLGVCGESKTGLPANAKVLFKQNDIMLQINKSCLAFIFALFQAGLNIFELV